MKMMSRETLQRHDRCGAHCAPRGVASDAETMGPHPLIVVESPSLAQALTPPSHASLGTACNGANERPARRLVLPFVYVVCEVREK